MSTEAHWMNDVHGIEQLRDELRVKAALLRADLRDELAALEEQWTKLARDLQPVRDAVETTGREIGASTKELLKTVRFGYQRIRDAARGHG